MNEKINTAKPSRNIFRIIGGVSQIVLSFICMFFSIVIISIFIFQIGTYGSLDLVLQNPILLFQSVTGVVGLMAFSFGLLGGILTLKRTRYLTKILGSLLGTLFIISFSILLILQSFISGANPSILLSSIVFSLCIIIFSILSFVFTLASKG